jgi:phosphoglucosamine mutase
VARRYFGTDGVRGVVGRDLTAELVERLGRAFATWRPGHVLVGRDTRGSGPELTDALVRGLSTAGAEVAIGGVLPTPAAALMSRNHAAVVSASHNPPEYNGVKFFTEHGRKLVDAEEEEIEARLDAPAEAAGAVWEEPGVAGRYLDYVLTRFGSDLSDLKIGVDCGNGAFASLGPRAFEQLGAEVVAIGVDPDGTNINVGCGATDLRALQEAVTSHGLDLGVAFDGDGDRMLAVDAAGEPVDGDQTLAILALHLGVDLVAVTVMTNLGFHRLLEERGVRVLTTDVGDRYVLEALRREGGVLGGEQSGHLIYLDGHVTGDGLAAALLLAGALEGRTLAEAAAVMRKLPQVVQNVPVRTKVITDDLRAEIERMSPDSARVLVRPSGTEPVVRVLAEAESRLEAEELCARISALVSRELG